MSGKLDEMDKELLGETNPEDGAMEDCARTLSSMAGKKSINVIQRGAITGNDKDLALSPGDHQCLTSKKRGTAPVSDASDDDKPIAKKRTIIMTAKAAANIKSEGDMGNAEVEPQTPSPKQRRRSTRKKSSVGPEGAVSPIAEGMTVRNTPRKRTAPKALAAARGIPSSWETADDADKMLITMKEAGDDWAKIREAWKQATGTEAAASTLPNRYNRIKANMMRLKDGEANILLAAKKQAEAEVWTHVANNMAAHGTEKYTPAFLQKKYKEFEDLAASTGTTVEDIVEQQAASASSSQPNTSQLTTSQPVSQTTQLSADDIAAGKAIDAFVEPQSDVGGSQ